jgi:hypothetical protein
VDLGNAFPAENERKEVVRDFSEFVLEVRLLEGLKGHRYHVRHDEKRNEDVKLRRRHNVKNVSEHCSGVRVIKYLWKLGTHDLGSLSLFLHLKLCGLVAVHKDANKNVHHQIPREKNSRNIENYKQRRIVLIRPSACIGGIDSRKHMIRPVVLRRKHIDGLHRWKYVVKVNRVRYPLALDTVCNIVAVKKMNHERICARIHLSGKKLHEENTKDQEDTQRKHNSVCNWTCGRRDG